MLDARAKGGAIMTGKLILVKAAYDPDAAVWFVESSDLPGVNAWGARLEDLLEKLPGVVLDLLEAGGEVVDDDLEVPIELVAHASTRAVRRVRTG